MNHAATNEARSAASGIPGTADRYAVDDYDLRPPFASFLPGIAGEEGIPLWAFYANRGQGLASFGPNGKHSPILEFKPADLTYRDLPTQGFRTFIRTESGVFEPFGPRPQGEPVRRRMVIEAATIAVKEFRTGWEVSAEYTTLANQPFPGLVRRLRVTNTSSSPSEVEILDGLPRIVPLGISDHTLKMMSTTAAAWIETHVDDPTMPAFRIRASMEDSVEVKPVAGANYVLPSTGAAQALPVIVDPAAVFGTDRSFALPLEFTAGGLDAVVAHEPQLLGVYPSAFTGVRQTLEPGESVEIRMVFGTYKDLDEIWPHRPNLIRADWVDGAFAEARGEVARVVAPATMRTANTNLDAYTRQTMLDNALRGGQPRFFPSGGAYRLYCRKHGDMERDYNDFLVPAEPYSSGFGNYRDINQNRRTDVAFDSRVGSSVLRELMNLVQVDGYNPLIVRPGQYHIPAGAAAACSLPGLEALEGQAVSLADLNRALGGKRDDLDTAVAACGYEAAGFFGEGYWVDHWTYNLDLVDEYLRIFPDRERDLYFGDRTYRWVLGERKVKPFQRHFDEMGSETFLEAEGGQWESPATLFERLAALAMVKAATLGPAATGVEMEAGRPGWYDALNGLPGILGTSLSVGSEALRLLKMLIAVAQAHGDEDVQLPASVLTLWHDVVPTFQEVTAAAWVDRWKARDRFRDALSPAEPAFERVSLNELRDSFSTVADLLGERLESAAVTNGGILPTYFRFNLDALVSDGKPYGAPVEPIVLPLFLEGAVKQMRLAETTARVSGIHGRVKASPLFDEGLGMYRLNDNLQDQPASIGRAKAFPHGWLENGSIWLHMEYKYLLELIKAGLAAEFWEEAQSCLIPFLPADRYGRSIYENSSFIASTSYPDASVHGKGFVARLSGATAEYLDMWHRFMLGNRPFVLDDAGELTFRPTPALPGDLFDEQDEIRFALFGATAVVYLNPGRRDLFAGEGPTRITLVAETGEQEEFDGVVTGAAATRVREGVYTEIVAEF